jgi:hypothetical protein
MTTNYFFERKHFLHQLPWGSAKAWSPAVGALLLQHYQRLLPYWPESRAFLPPADPELEREVLASLDSASREQIESAVEDIAAAARSQGQRLEATTRHLLSLLLAWSVYRDRGWLRAEDDPSEPLLRVFEQGYQLNYSDAGIELHFDGGWHTLRVPRRSEIAG